MKILSREQIQAADAYTIKTEPIASIDLMERAATKFVKALLKRHKIKNNIHVFCGKGNNGGDGLVAARLLHQDSFSVSTYIVEYSPNATDDFMTNRERLQKLHCPIFHLSENDAFPQIEQGDIIIDALWGTGLTRPVGGFAKNIIEAMNQSPAKVVALDIPSGLFCDAFNADKTIVKADDTISFQLPKKSFMLPENQDYVPEWTIVDIGLNSDFIQKQESCYYFTEAAEIRKLIRKRKGFEHKGTFGHALLVCGSKGKMGAAVLSAKACLRSGIGLATVCVPQAGNAIMQTAVPEAMTLVDEHSDIITKIPDTTAYSAVGIGPGLGTDKLTFKAFQDMLDQSDKPMIMDADAINMLAQHKELMEKLPSQTVLSPHIGEFDRLAGKSCNHDERLDKLQHLAKTYRITIILKGKYSAIANPEGELFFNPTGNPGMATAGSGDVLTGMIAAFLAQGYEAFIAAKIAVYLHGLAGDIAAGKQSKTALVAGDMIDFLPKAIRKFED
jgi:hydroxyethylthiazole kinase-like uncharacterized protein yjeF